MSVIPLKIASKVHIRSHHVLQCPWETEGGETEEVVTPYWVIVALVCHPTSFIPAALGVVSHRAPEKREAARLVLQAACGFGFGYEGQGQARWCECWEHSHQLLLMRQLIAFIQPALCTLSHRVRTVGSAPKGKSKRALQVTSVNDHPSLAVPK